jgi:hypothetical protein
VFAVSLFGSCLLSVLGIYCAGTSQRGDLSYRESTISKWLPFAEWSSCKSWGFFLLSIPYECLSKWPDLQISNRLGLHFLPPQYRDCIRKLHLFIGIVCSQSKGDIYLNSWPWYTLTLQSVARGRIAGFVEVQSISPVQFIAPDRAEQNLTESLPTNAF